MGLVDAMVWVLALGTRLLVCWLVVGSFIGFCRVFGAL